MAPIVRKRNRIVLLAAGIAGMLTLGGCATDGYGYGGVDVDYPGYAYNDGFYDPYYGPAGYYGGGYGGWYNDFYYPGGGYFVYDRRGARHRWTDQQRAYWQQRRLEHRGDEGRPNNGWRPGTRNKDRGPGWHDGGTPPTRPEGWRGGDRRQWRRDGGMAQPGPQAAPNPENRTVRDAGQNAGPAPGGFRQRAMEARPMGSPASSPRSRGGRSRP
ncbi:MAG TPA: peptidase [Sphingobium sp.]